MYIKFISILFVFILTNISSKEIIETTELEIQKTEIPEFVYSKNDHALQAFDWTKLLKYNSTGSLDIGKELP
ncbi:MAG: hypothetical protein ACJAWA_000692 [Nonlabens sp.]|jgi:hypothetical protein